MKAAEKAKIVALLDDQKLTDLEAKRATLNVQINILVAKLTLIDERIEGVKMLQRTVKTAEPDI